MARVPFENARGVAGDRPRLRAAANAVTLGPWKIAESREMQVRSYSLASAQKVASL